MFDRLDLLAFAADAADRPAGAAGLFDADVVTVLAEVGKQAAGPYNEAKGLPDHPVGLWGLLKGLREPEVQRAVGVGLHIVRRFGQSFNRPGNTPAPRG